MKKCIIIMAVLLCATIVLPLFGCSSKTEPKPPPFFTGEQRLRALEIAADMRAGGISPTTAETYSAGLREEYTGGNVYLVDVHGYMGIEVTLETENDYADTPVLIEALIPTGTIEIALGTLAPHDGFEWRIARPGSEYYDGYIYVMTGTWQRVSNNNDVALLCYITSRYESNVEAGQSPTTSTIEKNAETIDFIVVYDYGTNGIHLMTMDGKNFLAEMGYYNDVYATDKTDFILKNMSDTYSSIFSVFKRDE